VSGIRLLRSDEPFKRLISELADEVGLLRICVVMMRFIANDKLEIRWCELVGSSMDVKMCGSQSSGRGRLP